MFVVFSGGTIDLWIGASIISLLHLIIFVIKQCIYMTNKRTKTGKNLRAMIGSGPARSVWEFPASFGAAIAGPASAGRRTETTEEQGERVEEQERRNEEQDRRIEEQAKKIEEQAKKMEDILKRMEQLEIELGEKSGGLQRSSQGTLKIYCGE